MPVTLLFCAAAICLTITHQSESRMDALLLDSRAFWSEPWRLLTTHLVALHLTHLAVGLAWLLWFGKSIEPRVGSSTMLTVYVFVMLVAGLAMYAFGRSAFGLGSVVCGTWTFAEFGGRRCEQLRGALTKRTNELFWIWLVLAGLFAFFTSVGVVLWGPCAGLVAGALFGLSLERDARMRPRIVPGVIALLALLCLGATTWRSSWNFGGGIEDHLRVATRARDAHDMAAAESAVREALRIDPQDGKALWMLACLQADKPDFEAALDSGLRAADRVQLSSAQKGWLLDSLKWELGECKERKDDAARFEWARRGVKPFPTDLELWRTIDELARPLGHEDWKTRARAAVAKLEERR